MIFFACDNASPDTAESTDSFKNFETDENILLKVIEKTPTRQCFNNESFVVFVHHHHQLSKRKRQQKDS
jgi:hypothetical protein